MKETWALVLPWADPETGCVDDVKEWTGPLPKSRPEGWCIWYAADCDDIRQHRDDRLVKRWRPSIHMPRWASRITLEITRVRVERVQDITEADAKAEGVSPVMVDSGGFTQWDAPIDIPDYIEPFADLWDKLNAPRGHGWAVNPWLWVIDFERIKP